MIFRKLKRLSRSNPRILTVVLNFFQRLLQVTQISLRWFAMKFMPSKLCTCDLNLKRGVVVELLCELRHMDVQHVRKQNFCLSQLPAFSFRFCFLISLLSKYSLDLQKVIITFAYHNTIIDKFIKDFNNQSSQFGLFQ